MTTNDELDQRVAAIEHRLGMEHDPPLDRLSTIEFKIDNVASMVQRLGLTQGDQQRLLVALEARQLEQSRDITKQGRDITEIKVGLTTITGLLTTLIERDELGSD